MCRRSDIDVADPAVEHVVVELGSELASIVGVDHIDPEGQTSQKVVEELDGGLLVALWVCQKVGIWP